MLRGAFAGRGCFQSGRSDALGERMRKLVFVVVTFATVSWATAQSAKVPQPSQAQTHVGRYQLFFSPHARADVYLIDTETGRIWKPITITNARDTNLKSAPELWVYQERVDSAQDFDKWMSAHTLPDGATTPPQ